MQFCLVIIQDMSAPFDQIVHTLSADSLILCNFAAGNIVEYYILVYFLLMLCKQFTLKIIQ